MAGSNELLVGGQDTWRETESRNIVKVKKASFEWAQSSPNYTSAEVSRMSQAYSPSKLSVMGMIQMYTLHLNLFFRTNLS